MAPDHVAVRGGRLEVLDRGTGSPVLFVQTALMADELRPVAEHPLLDRYRTVLYHRRGYAGSSPGVAASIADESTDAAALLEVLGIDRAHVVGLSFSAAIALQLAADAPDRVRTLTLIEPPPVQVASAPAFRAANHRLLRLRRAAGPQAALDAFLGILFGPQGDRAAEDLLVGSATQMRRDAATFFDRDLPALLAWRFGADDAARIRCPVLSVRGTDSGPWFAEVAALMHDWFPAADHVAIDGADHSLALTHAAAVAGIVAAFLERQLR